MGKELNIVLKPHEFDVNEALVINRAGYYERVENHHIDRKGTTLLNEVIFLYCLDGAGWLRTPQNTYIVEKGMAIFCDRNAPHAYGTNPLHPWTLLWVHFSGAFSNYFSSALNSEQQCSIIPIGYHANIILHLHKIIQLLNKDEPLQRLTAYAYLKVCLYEVLLRHQQIKSQTLTINAYVDQSIEYMRQHLNISISLDELCYEIGLSKYYFSRQFKVATGLSPMTYFNRLKIQKACTLLISNTYRIQEISAMLGFSTPYYFSETFKQFTGFSPREYKSLQERKY